MPVYRKASDGKFYKADALTQAAADVIGIALTSAATSQPTSAQAGGSIALEAVAGITVGEIYVLSDTVDGKIAPAADLVSTNWVTVLGVGISATEIKLGILVSGVQVP
jgi:hypothetical protein